MSDDDLFRFVLVHRAVGYATAFVVVPAALVTFTRGPVHRRAGLAYVAAMIFLYLTGTYLTLLRHPPGTWEFARNISFNLLGFLFVLVGLRAMLRLRRGVVAERPSRALELLLAATSIALLLVGLRNTAARVFGLLGLMLAWLEWRDQTAARGDRRRLVVAHARAMLVSYLYVFTVLSLVHLSASRNVRWLWPTALGIPLVMLATRELAAGTPLRRAIGPRRAAAYLLLVAALLAPLVATQLALHGVPREPAGVRGEMPQAVAPP